MRIINNLLGLKWKFSAFSATTKHVVWWWDSSSSEWLLHAGGERTSQRGVEALWGAEEKLWEGEKKLHRGCYSPGSRGTLLFMWYYSSSSIKCFIFIFKSFCFSQKKAFEEDRAGWLKQQFLNMTPFTDRRCSSSDGQSALSISELNKGNLLH